MTALHHHSRHRALVFLLQPSKKETSRPRAAIEAEAAYESPVMQGHHGSCNAQT